MSFEESKVGMRGLLEAVKEIKNQYYVGTQEAFLAVKLGARIIEFPRKVADYVNQEADLHKTDYSATPERFNAILDAHLYVRDLYQNEFEAITDYLADLERDWSYNIADIFSNLTFQGFLHGDMETVHSLEIEDGLLESTVILFGNAKKAGVKDDLEFGNFVAHETSRAMVERNLPYDDILENNKALSEQIGGEIADEVRMKNLHALVYNSLNGLNWEEFTSKKYYGRKIRECIRESFCGNISYRKVLARLKRDRADHRLENRRSAIDLFLRSVDLPENSYQDVIEYVERRLRNWKEHYEESLSLKVSVVTENAGEYMEAFELLRRLLGREKNWVTKFMRN